MKGKSSKVAIYGLGGVGKTQVVLQFAYLARETHPDCSILWLPATNSESLQQAYVEAARQLGITDLEGQADVKELVQRHLSQESAGRWLLIFDNADDIDMWTNKNGDEQNSKALEDFLPRSNLGCILFTTRSRKIAVKLAPRDVMELSEMDEETTELLLRKSLTNKQLLNSHHDTMELLQQLTFLPLAIVQAAAYINNGIAFSNYLLLLKEQERDVIELLSEDFEDEGPYQTRKNPIATTWSISFEQIRRQDPLAAEYLSFMCCIDPRDVPQSLLPPAQSRKKEMDAIGTLNAYSFVHRRPGNNSLDLHRLVHLATRNWLRREESLPQWTLKAFSRLEEVFPDNDHNNRALWRTYLPHARYVLDSISVEDDVSRKTKLLCNFGNCLMEEGRYNEAEKYLVHDMEMTKRELGENDVETLKSILHVANMYHRRGRWKEAEKLQVQVRNEEKIVGGRSS